MAKKKKKFDTSGAEALRRNSEISEYGKLISLRPSKVFKSIKDYSRKIKHKGSRQDFLYFLLVIYRPLNSYNWRGY